MKHKILLTNGEIIKFPNVSVTFSIDRDEVMFIGKDGGILAWIPRKEILYILDESVTVEPSRKL